MRKFLKIIKLDTSTEISVTHIAELNRNAIQT